MHQHIIDTDCKEDHTRECEDLLNLYPYDPSYLKKVKLAGATIELDFGPDNSKLNRPGASMRNHLQGLWRAFRFPGEQPCK